VDCRLEGKSAKSPENVPYPFSSLVRICAGGRPQGQSLPRHFLEADRIAVARSGTPSAPIILRGVLAAGKRPVIDASRVDVRRCVFWVDPGVHDVIISRHNEDGFFATHGADYILIDNIHHSTEGENFKSRGDNTIFAFKKPSNLVFLTSLPTRRAVSPPA